MPHAVSQRPKQFSHARAIVQVKLETLKLIKEFVSAPTSSKQAIAKCHSVLLPAVAKSANEAAPDLREVSWRT